MTRLREPGAAWPQRERGFALLIVLWAVVLLTLLATQLTAAGRTGLLLAANLRAAAAAEAAADGAVHGAVFQLLDPARPAAADGTDRGLALAGGQAVIRIDDDAGRINPNTASPELLRALLLRAGAETRVADGVAAAIVDWRFPGAQRQPGGAKEPEYRAAGRDYGPPGAPFRNVGDLGAVLGMTPDLLTRLTPHLSVFSDAGPDPARATPLVRLALQDLSGGPIPPAPPRPPRTVTITARAALDGGGRFTRRATIRLGVTPREPLFQVLTWEALPD